MAQTVIWGTDASVTFPSGTGFLANAFNVSIRQNVARAVGFGKSWVAKNGTAKEYSGSISGINTHGTTSDQPALSSMTAAGVSLTLTFKTGCTFVDTVIINANDLSAVFEQAGGHSIGFEGPTGFTGPTVTWATS